MAKFQVVPNSIIVHGLKIKRLYGVNQFMVMIKNGQSMVIVNQTVHQKVITILLRPRWYQYNKYWVSSFLIFLKIIIYNNSFPVTGYDQLSVIHDGNLSSCSHKNSIKVFIKTDTIKCKEMCDNREECNYFYSNDSEYCVIYKSCEKSRRITTLGATPGRTYIKQIYYFS